MGQALYRKYRSKSLDEIVGQSHITDMLRRAIARDTIAHAYLLTGPRGVGKTSIARILAHEINGLPYTDESTHLDIIEIDAASNNSVEDIRDLREKVMVAPAVARKKIYIIDEVHMLSKSAFNALLKTLEEPPEHVVFILATTDADKLPATIISRVQRFNFRSIHPDDAARHLRTIADAEGIVIDDDALALIAHHGKGSFRDSISLLDQLRNLSENEVTRPLIEQVLGLAEADMIEQILHAYKSHDIQTIVTLLETSESRGTPALILTEQLIRTVRTRIVTEPELIPLLDKLLDIARSAWPHVKLLTALTSPSAFASSSVNSQQTAMPKPQTPQVPTTPKTEVKPQQKKTVSTSKPAVETKPTEDRPETTVATSVDTPALSADQPFPWTDFVAGLTSNTGARSLLTKCGHSFNGKKLTIFAGKKFYKTKLDAALPSLSAALQSVGVADGEIVILESAAPPKDSQTAAILDIMGGGEEVNL